MNSDEIYAYHFNAGEVMEFRLLKEEDSISELTQLLNKSYKALADMGLNYVAATQDDTITLRRAQSAYKCYIGLYKQRIAATISLYAPQPTEKSQWYSKDFVAKVGQFAVVPDLQRYGIGSRLMDIVEVEAKKLMGVREIALDTAETACHLIDLYKKRGYRYVETIAWGVTNYKSVVLSKGLLNDD